jgi:multidrug resistance efflux pump
MPESELPRIPIPRRQIWREFRVAFLPPLTFLALVILIGWMWSTYVEPGAIIGEVEMIRTKIISTSDGVVLNLKVDYLQAVTNGQVLGVVARLDTAQIEAELAAAETDLKLMKARMDLDRTRNLNSYSQLRVTLVEQRYGLDIARVRLQQAQQEFERAQKLLDHGVIARGVNSSLSGGNLISPRNDTGYEVAVRDRDALQAEVDGFETQVAELEQSVAALEQAGANRMNPEDAAVEDAIRAKRDQIQQLSKPQVLLAPIDGFISEIDHHTGERISAGETVMVVSGRSSARIVAWVHTPVGEPPHAGDIVEVRRMGMAQPRFEGTVVRVGAQLEEVSPMLRTPTANPERIEVGLPMLVEAERARELIPGEAVQLRVIRQAPAAVSN